MGTATREDAARQSSLIPYLHKGQGVRLSLLAGDEGQLKSAYPFSVLQDSHPFARLLTAEFVTDAGSIVRSMFMLVGKDAYRSSEDELLSRANPDIERCWQETFRLASSGSGDEQSIILAGQLGGDGELLACDPLFFCRARKRYFHPPCPDCGGPLQLCRDEDLLRKHGLSSWSRSLKRYLHCPACAGEEPAHYYVYELEPNDPATVLDRWGLIREFGRLHENLDPDNPFPCVNCSQWGSCYGHGQSSQSRIVPFSFYPFHMLLCKAASLHAMDFLALISGASREELTAELESRGEAGRVSSLGNWYVKGSASGFLYPRDDDRRFLELLYLKFSLLLDALRKTVAAGPGHSRLQLGPRIVGLWVDLPGAAGELPWLWSFRTRFVDLLKPEPDVPFMGTSPQAVSAFYLGLFWFQALTRNRNRSGRVILDQLKLVGTKMVAGDGIIDESELFRLFPPGEIFWHPDAEAVPIRYHRHWKSLIRLGAELITGGLSGRKEMPDEEFFRRAEEVREELRRDLSEAGRVRPAVSGSVDLRQIVLDIHRKWQSESIPAEGPVDEQGGGVFADSGSEAKLVETVLIPASEEKPETPAAAWGNDEVFETVILSPATAFTFPPADGVGGGEDNGKVSQPGKGIDQDEEANLDETVLLIKEPGRGRQRGRGSS